MQTWSRVLTLTECVLFLEVTHIIYIISPSQRASDKNGQNKIRCFLLLDHKAYSKRLRENQSLNQSENSCVGAIYWILHIQIFSSFLSSPWLAEENSRTLGKYSNNLRLVGLWFQHRCKTKYSSTKEVLGATSNLNYSTSYSRDASDSESQIQLFQVYFHGILYKEEEKSL